jgi:hypothetical protein
VAVYDIDGRLPGRGAWVCPSPACLDALNSGALAHVLKAPVQLAPAAARRRELAEALQRRIGNLLTIARRMRGVAFGQTGVRAALKEGRAKLVLVAGDVPAETAAAWTARAAPIAVRPAPVAAALGALLGRGPVSTAAVTVSGLAEALRKTIERWRAFSGQLCDNESSINDESPRAPRGSATARGG